MKKGTKYCIYCLLAGNNIGQYPCKCNAGGSHRIVAKGDKKYRVQDPKDGYVYLLREIPKGYKLVEAIVY